MMISFLILKAHSGGSVKEGVEDSKLSQRHPLGGYYRSPVEKSFVWTKVVAMGIKGRNDVRNT